MKSCDAPIGVGEIHRWRVTRVVPHVASAHAGHNLVD
jgi:hypothetical protein